MELMTCPSLAVPNDVMQHVVHVESAFNPYAIGVVGGRLARQPRNLGEAISTARMLEGRGFNFSVGLAQVNRHNLSRYGLSSYESAFDPCLNLQAGSRILAECHSRAGGDWGRAFSCYYSGNFTTGFRHGYVQKVYASMRSSGKDARVAPIAVIAPDPPRKRDAARSSRKLADDAPESSRLATLSVEREPVEPLPTVRDAGQELATHQGDRAFVF